MNKFKDDWTKVYDEMVYNISEKQKIIDMVIEQNSELSEACKMAEDALDIASTEHPTFLKIRDTLRAAIAKATLDK